jgi:hypothetical protein
MINKKGFIRKTTEKKEVTDAPEDGDTKTERGVKFKRVNGKWSQTQSYTFKLHTTFCFSITIFWCISYFFFLCSFADETFFVNHSYLR